MNWSAGLVWWTALKLGRRAESADDDRADMGTAFGLDASMAGPDAEFDVPPPRADAPARWEQRLIRRSGL